MPFSSNLMPYEDRLHCSVKEKFSLKDALFNERRVTYLAELFVAVDGNFQNKKFVKEVVEKFPELELKARIGWMAEVLARYLSGDVSMAMKLIIRALPPELDENQTDDDFGEFILAPLGEYVVRHGCVIEYVEQALDTLYEITKRFSMEDAMRSFLNNFPDETLGRFDRWVNDNNYHVRRLVSESSRPLLPWSRRLSLLYHVPLKYLDVLYADKTRYVTRSVANHLNDISKKDPTLVIVTLARWLKEGGQTDKELTWMTRHALRTLVKRGDVRALALLGYRPAADVTVRQFALEKGESDIRRGDTLVVTCALLAAQNTAGLIDYIIDFVKANGQTKPKVFRWKKLSLKAGQGEVLIKRHHLKADATTFKLYPGEYKITLQINGSKRQSLVLRVQ